MSGSGRLLYTPTRANSPIISPPIVHSVYKRSNGMWAPRRATITNDGMLSVFKGSEEPKNYKLIESKTVAIGKKNEKLYIGIIDKDGKKLVLKIKEDIKKWISEIFKMREAFGVKVDASFNTPSPFSRISSPGGRFLTI